MSESGLTLWVNIPDRGPIEGGEALGVDIGVNKLLSDSNGNHYGTDFKPIRDKIKRRKPKSKNRKKAFKERDNFVNRTVNQLPWKTLSIVGVEALHNLKKGKKKNRSKAFRKAMAPWTYRQVLTRISQKAQENRVLLVSVDPANTSRSCPNCGMVSKENRNGEKFQCIICGYTDDADHVGALNILARTLATQGSVESPWPQEPFEMSLK